MYQLLTTQDLYRAGFRSSAIPALIRCCLLKVQHGLYAVHKVCQDPKHHFIRALATTNNTTLVGHQKGLRSAHEYSQLLVESAGSRIPDGAVLSHVSAGLLHELPITEFRDNRLEMVWNRPTQTRKSMRMRQRPVPEASLLSADGVPYTNIETTLLDLAIDYPLHVSVPALDFALHTGKTNINKLRNASHTRTSRRNRVRMLTAVKLSNGLRESPGESLMAVGFHTYGITGFQWQVEIFSPQRLFLGRVDAVNEEAMLISEFDGAGKYGLDGKDPRESLDAERHREYPLRNMGYSIYRVTWADVWKSDIYQLIKQAINAKRRVRGR